MSQFLSYAIPAVPVGCVYALVAAGLVLTYKTSGVFNLAFGAQAYVSAVVFYEAVGSGHWPKWLAVLVSVVLVGPLLGLVLDRGLFRFMRTASTAVKLISGLGLLVGIPSIVQFVFGNGRKLGPPTLVSHRAAQHLVWRRYGFTENQLVTVLVTLAVVAALGALFKWSALGLKMRAVVESPRMVQLAGINADRVATSAWMLSGFLAGLAGVLLAPLFAEVDANDFTTLLVVAIAAAAVGRLSNLPLTLAGGVLLGVGQQTITGYLPLNSILATGLRPSFPFLVLVLLLLFLPGLRQRREAVDPLAACDPPPPALAATMRDERLNRLNLISAPILILVFVWVSQLFVSNRLLIFTQGIVYSTIFLSITLITGLAGQLSLCQATFAGVGAFTTAQLATNHGMPVLAAMLIAAVVAAALGALVAIPALRLGGLYLSLATLAFALMADYVLFPLRQVSGGLAGVDVPRPVVGPVDFSSDWPFLLLSLAVLVVCSFVVILVRKGTLGRYLAALRGSELAATTIGINPVRAKITIFALSAGIAGIGGALLGTFDRHVAADDFSYFFSLFFMVLVLTTGSRTVEGAINAGIAFALFPELLGHLETWTHLHNLQILEFAGFGFGAITFAKHPEGIVEANKRKSMQRLVAWMDRRRARNDAGDHDGSGPSVAEPIAVGATAAGNAPQEAGS